ncbi:hypothetical protein LPA44_06250 [Halobacterium sp. KA-4]|uniref:hypothetical protein n=1 Tax=Halobacterium sp. KA-4 TaxID=2896367 RepID=UPI001E36A5EF|nr:hypothetical protein [Halobacterium sp. KA-4]MCD2199498.1 hypothetical protein [Halobacterium sp. KA-4]
METRPLEPTRAGTTEIGPGTWKMGGDCRDADETQVRAVRATLGANVDCLGAVGVRGDGRGE